MPICLNIGLGADLVCSTAKGVRVLQGTGTMEDFQNQATATLVAWSTSKLVNKAFEKTIVRTGLKTVAFRNNLNGQFISNWLGKTSGAVRDATNVMIGPFVNDKIKK
ncbi:MAG: hypothetical protein LWX56_11165 [Ignavibacteria bacterium]|nr:hypothetical protein [Ignavibacteria bacterium]